MGCLKKVALWLPYMKLPLEASRRLRKPKMAILAPKSLKTILTASFWAQRLYLGPTIQTGCVDGLSEESCSMVALHEIASRGL